MDPRPTRFRTVGVVVGLVVLLALPLGATWHSSGGRSLSSGAEPSHPPAGSPRGGAGAADPAAGVSGVVFAPPPVVPGEVVGTVDLANGSETPGLARGSDVLAVGAMALDPASGLLYLIGVEPPTLHAQAGLFEIDTRSGEVVGSEPAGSGASALAFDPASGALFVDYPAAGNVTELNASTGRFVGSVGGLASPTALAVAPSLDRLYVAAGSGDAITVVNTSSLSVVATPEVGSQPTAVAVDPRSGEVFVANYGSGNVTALDGVDGAVLGSVAVGSEPSGLAFDPVSDQLFVVDSGSANLTVVNASALTTQGSIAALPGTDDAAWDPTSGDLFAVDSFAAENSVEVIAPGNGTTIAVVPLGPIPGEVVPDPATGSVYVTLGPSDEVVVLNSTSDRLVGPIAIGTEPRDVAFDAKDDRLFVENYLGRDVEVLNATSGGLEAWLALPTLGSEVGSESLLYDPGNGLLYVADGSGAVDAFGAGNLTPVASVPVGVVPVALALDPTAGRLYVANLDSDNVSVINTSQQAVVRTLPELAAPDGIAVDRQDGELFVSDDASQNVSVFALGTGALVGLVSTPGSYPGAIAYDPATDDLYVLGISSNVVLVVNGATDTRVTTYPLFGLAPAAVVVDPQNGYVYIGAGGNQTVVLDGANGTVLGSVSVGPGPDALAFDGETGSVVVAGATGGTLSIVRPLYYVTFSENGLPFRLLDRDGWTVALNGTGGQWLANAVTYAVPNGTYAYLASGPSGYRLTGAAPSGTVTVDDAGVSFDLTATPGATRELTVRERGLPGGQLWCVELGGWPLCSVSGAAAYHNLTPGTYAYGAVPLVGQAISAKAQGGPVPTSGVLSLAHSTTLSLTYVYRYAVTFLENGLPAGTNWSVTIAGVRAANLSPGQLVLSEKNGSYRYTVGPVTGYRATGVPARLLVSGSAASVNVTFVPKRPNPWG